jgi:ferric-dicitrate binding protein FerR (iron transport regulator)
VVNTPAADVEVLGTEFDVSVAGGETEVKVVRGVVAVRNPHGQQRLWARESAVARADSAPRQLVPVRGTVIEGSPDVKRQPP